MKITHAQFRIDTLSPHIKNDPNANATKLPIAVWVHYPPTTSNRCPKGNQVYRVDPQLANAARQKIGAPPVKSLSFTVCGCMGEIIK